MTKSKPSYHPPYGVVPLWPPIYVPETTPLQRLLELYRNGEIELFELLEKLDVLATHP
jgi:hypothetical protein